MLRAVYMETRHGRSEKIVPGAVKPQGEESRKGVYSPSSSEDGFAGKGGERRGNGQKGSAEVYPSGIKKEERRQKEEKGIRYHFGERVGVVQ